MTIGGYLLPAVLGEFRRRYTPAWNSATGHRQHRRPSRRGSSTAHTRPGTESRGRGQRTRRLDARVFHEDELIVIAPSESSVRGAIGPGRRAAPVDHRAASSARNPMDRPRTGQRHARGTHPHPGRRRERTRRDRADPGERGGDQTRGHRRVGSGGSLAVVRNHGTGGRCVDGDTGAGPEAASVLVRIDPARPSAQPVGAGFHGIARQAAARLKPTASGSARPGILLSFS